MFEVHVPDDVSRQVSILHIVRVPMAHRTSIVFACALRADRGMATVRSMRKDEALRFVADNAALFDVAGRDNPFACSAWTVNFIEQVCDVDSGFVILETGDSAPALMLLRSASGNPRRLSCVANYYCSLYSPVISSPPHREEAVRHLVNALTDARPCFDSVDFSPLDASECNPLGRAFRRRNWYAKRYFCFGNWYLPVSFDSFDAYMATRPSQLRNTLRRKSKKFEDAKGRLEVVVDPAMASAGIDAFDAVYGRSWKQPEPFPDFVPNWARTCAKNGWLRLGLAWLDGTPIAAQFWFTKDHRAFIFKLAYDEEYGALSAGTLLTAHLMKHAIEVDRVTEIDYLSGDDEYKKTWMSERRERVGLRACNLRSWGGLLSAAYESCGELRRRVRGSRSSAAASRQYV